MIFGGESRSGIALRRLVAILVVVSAASVQAASPSAATPISDPLVQSPQYSAAVNGEIADIDREVQHYNSNDQDLASQQSRLDVETNQLAGMDKELLDEKADLQRRFDEHDARAGSVGNDPAAIKAYNDEDKELLDEKNKLNERIDDENTYRGALRRRQEGLDSERAGLDKRRSGIQEEINDTATRAAQQASSVGPGVPRAAIPDYALGGKGQWRPQNNTKPNGQDTDALPWQQAVTGVDPLKYAYMVGGRELDGFRADLAPYPDGVVLDAKTAVPRFIVQYGASGGPPDAGNKDWVAGSKFMTTDVPRWENDAKAAQKAGMPYAIIIKDEASAQALRQIFQGRGAGALVYVYGPSDVARLGGWFE